MHGETVKFKIQCNFICIISI